MFFLIYLPQLDLLTLSIQISVMIFYGWGLFVIISNLILPQYFIINHSKKIFWFYLNNLIIQIKLYVYLSYTHIITSFTFFVKGTLNKTILIKNLVDNFSKSFLSLIKIKKKISLFLKNFFFQKTFLVNNIFIEKYKLNVFEKNFLIYIFIQKYKSKFCNKFFVTKRKKKKIMVREMTKFWTFEDKLYTKDYRQLNILHKTNINLIYKIKC